MNNTGWALGLGALLKGPEYVNSGFDLYKNIRDYADGQANNQAARNVIDNLAWSNQEQDPQVRLENLREVSRDASGQPLNATTALALQNEIDKGAKEATGLYKQQQDNLQLQQFAQKAKASGQDLFTYATQNPDQIPLSQLQTVHNVFSTLQTGVEKEAERRLKTFQEQQKLDNAQNISDFQGAIAGLTDKSTSPIDLQNFAKNGGYAPFPQVESDIRQAAQAYNVGNSDEVNKAVDDARSLYKDTYLPTELVKVGRTTASGQRNLLGDFRKDVASTAPITNINMYGAGGPGAVTAWADRIANGEATIGEVPRQTKDAVMNDLAKRYPNVDLSKLKANQKFAQAPGNLQSRALADGVFPLYDKLLETGKTLGNSSVPGVNKVVNWVKEQSGNPDIVAFNNLRDDVIAESERVLLGSGVLSDSKYLRAIKNVNSAQSYPQLQAAVKQLKLTVNSRLEALDKTPYPNAGNKKVTAPVQITPQQAAAELARRRAGRK